MQRLTTLLIAACALVLALVAIAPDEASAAWRRGLSGRAADIAPVMEMPIEAEGELLICEVIVAPLERPEDTLCGLWRRLPQLSMDLGKRRASSRTTGNLTIHLWDLHEDIKSPAGCVEFLRGQGRTSLGSGV